MDSRRSAPVFDAESEPPAKMLHPSTDGKEGKQTRVVDLDTMATTITISEAVMAQEASENVQALRKLISTDSENGRAIDLALIKIEDDDAMYQERLTQLNALVATYEAKHKTFEKRLHDRANLEKRLQDRVGECEMPRVELDEIKTNDEQARVEKLVHDATAKTKQDHEFMEKASAQLLATTRTDCEKKIQRHEKNAMEVKVKVEKQKNEDLRKSWSAKLAEQAAKHKEEIKEKEESCKAKLADLKEKHEKSETEWKAKVTDAEKKYRDEAQKTKAYSNVMEATKKFFQTKGEDGSG